MAYDFNLAYVVHNSVSPLADSMSDQCAFRPAGSTTAAVISLVHETTFLLADNAYVHIISLDFSCAFDVRHCKLFEKLESLPMPDNIYTWLLDFFKQRSHLTKYGQTISERAYINASVVQGAALRPILFNMNSSDLKATMPCNIFTYICQIC